MRNCSIIIPIFNAYDATKDAIESVIKYTDLKANKLILINDKSTDSRISSLLKSYVSYATIIENDENLGFVKTVNKGMKLDDNDVLLLNSDTEVTKNWLQKIQHCAYIDDNIATVTPLSNNATLASVPKAFYPNNLPENYTLQEMGDLVEDCSYHEYPEIPTGHGFCLFIKRNVLEIVGYFDEESFGKGYGEESDFCYRCFNYGFRHVLCDDVYIYHKESQSFSSSRLERIEQAGKIIKQRYPNYLKRLDSWCTRKPHQYLGDNIALHIGAKEKKVNILYIIHDWDKSNLGGTTLHASDLINSLRKKYNFHVFAKNDNGYVLYSYYESTDTMIQFEDIEEFKDLRFYNNEYQRLLDKIIQDFGISIVHIHHLKEHYFNITALIEKYNLYTIISLHDYYSICPQITKLYKNCSYCGLNVTKNTCEECLKYIFKNSIDIESWRNEWFKLLKSANKIVVPSESSKREISQIYSNLDINVIEHGINFKKERSKLKIDESDTFDVAFIGAIGIHKGSKILENFIKRKDWKNVRIHLFGILDSQLYKNNKHYINHGRYERGQLVSQLKENNIKLICLLSTVPETYSYTLSESLAAGIPVIAYDLGAIGERMKKYEAGWLISSTLSADEIAGKIIEISKNPIEYQKMIDKINNISLKNTKEMAKDYDKIYQTVGKKENIEIESIKKMLREQKSYLPVKIIDSSAWVFDTFKWKIISKLKIPMSLKNISKRIRTRR